MISVGQLKSRQIQSYLQERLADAVVISRFTMSPLAQYWLTHHGMDPPANLDQLAEVIGASYQYRQILVLDAAANVRLHTGSTGMLSEAGNAIALRSMRERSAAFFNIYFGDPSTPDEPVLDTFVPVTSINGKTIVGVIVLRNELKFLSELLQGWPVESETAESALVTKDGGHVLFLSQLRYNRTAAATLRIPLSADAKAPAWPAMLAATGHVGLLEANDYRGKRVLAYTLAVPGTSWGMLVKIDLDEAVAHSQKLLRIALIVAAILTACTAIIAWLWWRKETIDLVANRHLRESEARYRRLHESMMDAYVMVDMRGQILDFNHAYMDMLGYTDEDLRRVAYAELTPEKWHEVEANIVREQVIPRGYSQVYEKQYVRKDGTILPVELKTFLLRDADEQPEAMWSIVRDITERVQSEETLRFHSQILESLSEGIVLVRASDGMIVFANPRFEHMFGYEPGELDGKHVSTVNAPEAGDPKETATAIMSELAKSGRWAGEVQNVRKDGTTLWCYASVSTFDHLRLGKLWVAAHSDITERKVSEQRLRELASHLQAVREEEKAGIAREIHDDLGGTLTALKMEAYWLADELSASNEHSPLLKHVQLISQLAEDAVNVMRRVITGLRPAILDDLGLLAAIEWQAEQFQRHTGITCRVNNIEDKVKVDKQRSIALFRIFQETLTNVAKHSGASRVEIEYHCSDEEVMLSVSDNGRGLPEGHLAAPTSFGMRGMKERVEQLGGKLAFESNSRGGFTVTATLPLHVDRRKGIRA